MKRSQQKKLRGAEGRKRRKAQDEECAKSSNILSAFLKGGKSSESKSTSVENVTKLTSHNSSEILEQEDLKARFK
jgi:hypothetical protein